jgi:hypothetical protein
MYRMVTERLGNLGSERVHYKVDLPKHLTKQGNFGAPIEHGLHNFKPFGELVGATILLNPDT